MNNSDHDPLLARTIDELKRLPAVDAAAVDRVVAAAALARVTPADEPANDVSIRERPWSRTWRVAVSLAMVSAAALVGFMVRGLPPAAAPAADSASQVRSATASSANAKPAVSGVTEVADVAGVAKPVLHQFVFQSARAKRVSVVGDFNQWNSSSAPMVRSADGTLWSVVVPILPGRHVYAYMVDDSVLTLDPAAATTRDPDFGTKASAVLVRTP